MASTTRRLITGAALATGVLLAAALIYLSGHTLLGLGEPAQASHSTSTIDSVAIDMDPTGNGSAAVGDRNFDALPDAEGSGSAPSGICGNGIDDDHDNGVTVSPDGVADDGCAATLSARQTCARISLNGVQDADEDAVDRVFLDITVGKQAGPGGGVPADRPMTAFDYTFNWSPDVLDAISRNNFFLIASSGADQPFNNFTLPVTLPATDSPLLVSVTDADSTPETGPGVLSRLTVQGMASGVATLSLTAVDVRDNLNEAIPVDNVYSAFIAVNNPTACADADGDGIIDSLDQCAGTPVGQTVDPNGCSQGQVDGDLDGRCDPGKSSTFCTGSDNCPFAANPGQQDFDSDGLGDACDPDVDGDGIANAPDVCPSTPLGATIDANGCSQGQVDGDGDGVCDPGAPSPGPAPGCTGSDNCPAAANPGQQNFDGDSLGDACDPDDDNDGLPDASEPPACVLDSDCDNDTISDGSLDPDAGGPILSGPDNCITTPNANQADFDGDGVGDACDSDKDGDGVPNASDQCATALEDMDGVDDTDGCPETDSGITLVTADGSFIVQQNVDDSRQVAITVANNGNISASLQLSFVLRSTSGQCEARWVSDGSHPDSVFDSVISGTLFSQLEHAEVAVLAGQSRSTTHTYTVHCFQAPGFYDNAVRLQIGVAPVLPVRENSGAGADNAYNQLIDITVGEPSDVEKVDLIVPNTQLQVGAAQIITVSSVLRNNGPFGPTDVIDHLTASAPADCTVTPPSYDTATSLPVGVNVTLDNTFSLQCSTPSFHTFSFANQVDVNQLNIADPNPANNSRSVQPVFPVLADTDLDVQSVNVSAPVSQPANTPFNVTITGTVANNGPYTPVDASATFGLSLPPDCTKIPSGTQSEASVSLVSGTPVALQKVWQVSCAQPSLHVFTGTVSLAALDQHVNDISPGNNSNNGTFGSAITVNADVLTTNASSSRDDLPNVSGVQVLVGPLPPIDPLPESESFTLNELLHNNGPYGPVSVTVTHTATDEPTVCTATPSFVQTNLVLQVSASTLHSEPFTVDWLDDPAPPLFCTVTIDKTVSIATPHVLDPNAANNSSQITLDIVRDSDADGVPDDYTARGGPADNCPTTPNANQSDLDNDGVGDVCDPEPYHDTTVKYCLGFGPAPVALSDTAGTYMWVNCEVGNDSSMGGTLPGHNDTVTLSWNVTGFPTDCGPSPSFPNSGVQTTLVLPGSPTFVLLDGEQRFVLLRVRLECHAPALPNVYPVSVSLTIDHQNTGGGDEAPAQEANNTATVDRNVIIYTADEPRADAKVISTAEDTPVLVTLSGSDYQQCELTFATAAATNGTLGAVANSPCAAGTPNTDSATVTFTPAANVCGPGAASFSYTVNDGTFASTSAPVTVDITCANDTPVGNSVTMETTEDTPVLVTLTGTDVETCELTFATGLATNGSLGAITNNACTGGSPNSDSATVTFTPTANVCSPSEGSFTYTVDDGSAASPPATATVTITCQNDIPVATSQVVTTTINTPIIVTLAGSDVETCELTLAAGGAVNGTLSAITDSGCAPGSPNTDAATITFTPDLNVCDPIQGSFTYTVDDGTSVSLPATVTVNITC